MLRLHYHPLSPYCRKALVAVYHRGDEVAHELVDIFGDAIHSPAFRALSPFGKMPFLESPDGVIYESTSIIEYLESRGPRLLIPLDPTEARLARHLDRIGDLYIINAQKTLWWCPNGGEAPDARDLALKAWDVLTQQLADGRHYLLGDWFTLADIGAAIGSDYLMRVGMNPPSALLPWLQRCFAVEAMHRALNEALPFANSIIEERKQRTQRARR